MHWVHSQLNCHVSKTDQLMAALPKNYSYQSLVIINNNNIIVILIWLVDFEHKFKISKA